MKIMKRKLTTIGASRGFVIPVGYTADRMEGGLREDVEYDLEINESKEEVTE